MKKFSLKSFEISNMYYQPIRENLTEMSKNDTILFHMLKGMKLIEEKKYDFPEKIEITRPQTLISLHLSDSINNHIHQYAFDRRMNSNALVNSYLKVSLNASEQLSVEEINAIKNEIQDLQNMVAPYIQADISRIEQAIRLGHLEN